MVDKVSDDHGFAQVEKRQDLYEEKQITKIWQEIPSSKNPYIAQASLCHGYNLLELIEKKSFIDVLYLLFRGELPCNDGRELLEKTFIAFINPGPRHPSTRAAIDAGIGKTDPELILPIGLNLLSGEYCGAAEVEHAMRWLRKNRKHNPKQLFESLLDEQNENSSVVSIAPGFGTLYGGIDELVLSIADTLKCLPAAGNIMSWGDAFVKASSPYGFSWLSTGLVAAVLCDLGFQPRMGAGLFQMMSAPGIFAHSIEVANKPITAMPFIDDEQYIIESDKEDVNV
ncbi:MAG: citrate synthase [Cellvibrionaceae bacterium]